MTRHIDSIAAMKPLVGEHLGFSDWLTVTQEQVNLFADATGDHQWIHIDVERAKSGPFGGPIAHGYLTLSLGPVLIPKVFSVGGVAMGVNYGCNKVRFMSPVPVGARLRAGVKLLGVDDVSGGAQVTLEVTFECEGAAKPSCIAEIIFRYYSA
ncbi:MAG: MaoC family dehydratase [Acidimicrobiales bacterium]